MNRPWWVGPAVAAAALTAIYTSPLASATVVRSVAERGVEFLSAVADGLTEHTPEVPQ